MIYYKRFTYLCSNFKYLIMATTIHYPSEASTIDALWTILSQQSENVKQALVTRLADSLAAEKYIPKKNMNKTAYNPQYSARINRLRSLCGKEIPQEIIQEDERLAYLLNK